MHNEGFRLGLSFWFGVRQKLVRPTIPFFAGPVLEQNGDLTISQNVCFYVSICVCGGMMIGRWGSCAGLSLVRINSLPKPLLMPGWRHVAVQCSTN